MNCKPRKFLLLPAAEKQALFLAMLWLPLMHFRLKWFGLNSCLAFLAEKTGGLKQQDTLTAKQYDQILGYQRCIALAAHYGLVSGTCLSRSLTTMRILAYQGMSGQLRIGVNIKDSGMLDAHAWVEIAGVSLEQEEAKFTTFPPLIVNKVD